MTRPYSSTVRDEAAQKTRTRIIAAAIRQLRAKGADGFSLDAVAKKARVTRLTVYNQFGSRRQLLEAVFDHYALHGGLNRLGEAMGAPEPRAGLTRLVEIFCDFWSSDHDAFANLLAMGAAGTEFETALRMRNERRRGMIAILLARMAERGEIAADTGDLAELLFALTSFAFFAELARDRGIHYARIQIEGLTELAVCRAANPVAGKVAAAKKHRENQPLSRRTHPR